MRKEFLLLGILIVGAFSLALSSIFVYYQDEKDKISLLEKVYLALKDFERVSDQKVILWKGENAERFKKLAQIPPNFPIFIQVEIDSFQSPKETLKEKKGDCEDFAILFVSAARALKIPARVVIGKVSFSEDFHALSEIFYQGKWRMIDPWKAPEGLPFRFFLSHNYSPFERILVKFDENIIFGKNPKRLVENVWKNEKKEKELFEKLLSLFVKFQKRGLFQEELKELKEISALLDKEILQLVIREIPEDPRFLIESSQVKDWLKEILGA